jgi:glutamate dehydrogenase
MTGLPETLTAEFLEHYFRFATPEDVPATGPARETLALSHLDWGRERKPGRIMVRVFNPADAAAMHTVIETITDDSPFIVDSLTMLLNRISQGVLVKLHCVLDVERDARGRIGACCGNLTQGLSHASPSGQAESWTHFEIPRVIDVRELAALERQVRACLADVRSVYRDWPRMLRTLARAADDLRKFAKGKEVDESARFLEWLADHHFTLLGHCVLPATQGKAGKRAARESPRARELGLLRNENLRAALRQPADRSKRRRELLTITKAPIRSTVHRPALLDDIRVEAFAEDGSPLGEHRFLGLFTSAAYYESTREIPLVGARVDRVIQRSGLDPVGHRGKALRHILDTFPRDALIQSGVAELERIAIGILNLEEKRRIRAFFSTSAYGDFLLCLIYLPRDGYNPRARARVEALLEETLGGKVVESELTISESMLARLSVTIQREKPDAAAAGARSPDFLALEAQLAEVAAAWTDRARLALLASLPEEQALALHRRLAPAFPLAYQEAADGARVVRDFTLCVAIADGASEVAFRLVASHAKATLTAFSAGQAIPLYLANPILENMGFRLLRETSYRVETAPRSVWVQDFDVESTHGADLAATGLDRRVEDCFAKTLDGSAENDSCNQLVVGAGLDWREAVIIRTFSRYLLQCRAQFSQAYMVETLRRHAPFARAFAALFAGSFDPARSKASRAATVEAEQAKLQTALNDVASLDEDRILRMFSTALHATLRTNYFQRSNGAPKPWLSIKLDSARIPELPEPRPKCEIFVYTPEVEGVHLRGAAIARGGIRWSDRREDFRTEVLGLMKAQQVKNTVIVPAGAKGGFVVRRPPAGDRAALQAHAIECYKTFLRGLLDLTDNIVGERTVAPADTICRDAPDPYLVVAADKGTATFSDTANAVAAEYGFWLGDAFASGGSAGYDHKEMGITARGAFESVKRHFRELGKDAGNDAFTAIGIGDMSGDVFGNGMLLAAQMRLIAAFDHRHIFIDPDPDAAAAFAERKRLFALPRSSWDDYDRRALSRGGEIYSRQSKAIRLSPEAQAALGIDRAELTPPELIRAVLAAPVDLLWNGGIGTYVKASTESHADAADPANDAVRVEGKALRAKVVAEGGNLGFTQRGRIEYALAGGRINTDFIDNSGGVDCSDHEVNIKILLNNLPKGARMTLGERNKLLKSMTDDIARSVLANNYAQTQALSMLHSHALERVGEHAHLIRILESRGLLKRDLEFLPSDEEIDERRRDGRGFTRPELAVILSYAKIELRDSLLATAIPDDPLCQAEVAAYFPEKLRKRFAQSISSHRLKREIAAMLISSNVINRMGPFFALRARDDTGADMESLGRAYAVVRALFNTPELWRGIEALDGQVQAQVQYDSFYEVGRMFRRAVYWFLHRPESNRDIATALARLQEPVAAVRKALPAVLCGWSKRGFERDLAAFESIGLPRALGTRIASLRLMTQIIDIADLAAELEVEPLVVARLHFELGRGLWLDWIREQIEELKVEGHWRALARSTLRETLARDQRALLAKIIRRGRGRGGNCDAALAAWLTASDKRIARLKRTLNEMHTAGQTDFATLSIALKEIGRLR